MFVSKEIEFLVDPCQDDPNFRILINASTNRFESCSWIDGSNNVDEVLFRRNAQCIKASVQDACRRACGKCSTSEPTASPTVLTTSSSTVPSTEQKGKQAGASKLRVNRFSDYMIPTIVCGCFLLAILVRTINRCKRDKDYKRTLAKGDEENHDVSNQKGWCLPSLPNELFDCSWFLCNQDDNADPSGGTETTKNSKETSKFSSFIEFPIDSIQDDSFYTEQSISNITDTESNIESQHV